MSDANFGSFSGIANVSITAVCIRLGSEPKRGRIRAFWRESCDFNISIDERSGTYFDHVRGEGGGILKFVQTALGCHRQVAVNWLIANGFLRERKPTTAERQALAAAPLIASDIAHWAHGVRLFAQERKRDLMLLLEFAWRENASHIADFCMRELHKLPAALNVERMNPSNVAAAYVRLSRTNPRAIRRFAAIGKGDAEHAGAITDAIVAILATLDIGEAAGWSTRHVSPPPRGKSLKVIPIYGPMETPEMALQWTCRTRGVSVS